MRIAILTMVIMTLSTATASADVDLTKLNAAYEALGHVEGDANEKQRRAMLTRLQWSSAVGVLMAYRKKCDDGLPVTEGAKAYVDELAKSPPWGSRLTADDAAQIAADGTRSYDSLDCANHSEQELEAEAGSKAASLDEMENQVLSRVKLMLQLRRYIDELTFDTLAQF